MKITLAVLMLAGFSALLSAGETACVYKLRGQVFMMAPGGADWRPLAKPSPLKEGFRIKTGPKGWCQILAADGTMLDVDENSEVSAETLKLEKDAPCEGSAPKDCVPRTASRDFGFTFVKGKIMWLFAKFKEKASKLEVRTPRAVCAIRGTAFTILASSDSSDIGLFEGDLSLKSEGTETTLAPGSEASVSSVAPLRVDDHFSRLMRTEARRYATLAKYAEEVRKKLAARDGFIDDFLKLRDKKLQDFEQRRREKLNKAK